MLRFALAGNQNCGKTTLFNQLTGSNQHVGNFPGVTVEQKSGEIRGQKDAVVVDLPGIYSLSPYTQEEIVTRDYLINEKPDCIINIIDATNIERNLYLTLQLIELNIPMIIALNMMDEIKLSGNSIDASKLSDKLGVAIVPISASKNDGVSELIKKAVEIAGKKIKPLKNDFCTGAVHRAIHSVAHIVEDHAEAIGVSAKFAAGKLLEGDEPLKKALMLSDNELELLEHTINEVETVTGLRSDAALADMRYKYIESLCSGAVFKNNSNHALERSLKIDAVLTNKYFAIPIFLLIMFEIFALTFGFLGQGLSDLLSALIDKITAAADAGLAAYGLNPVIHSLIIDGVFSGVGSVLSFLPIIVVLFFFLSILEDSGYMARVAFVMDKALRCIGLSGRSFVPMLVGFGCSVPAIMATRTMGSDRDRKMTMLLIPFMSCSAKLPIYAVFTAAFFPRYAAFVMIGIYVLGIIIGILCGLVFKGTLFKGNPVPFIMELPPYRLPSVKSVCLLMWEKARDFFMKAFTIILAASVIIWFLQSFDTKLNIVADSSLSMLAGIGKFIAPIFKPLGFGDWRIPAALVTGLSAKEAVVSTLAVLTGSTVSNLPAVLNSVFTPVSAAAFLTFTLLYTPCAAAMATVRKELKSGTKAFGIAAFQCCIAYLAAFLVHSILTLIF